MDYTHYWYASARETKKDALDIISKIIEHGLEKKIIDSEFYCINSKEISFGDFEKRSFFRYLVYGSYSYCKTNKYPYDLYVCSCILVSKFYDRYISFHSDGDYIEGEWKDAVAFLLKNKKDFNLPINLVKSLEKIQDYKDLFKIYPYYNFYREVNFPHENQFIFNRSCAFNLDRKIGETDEQLKERAIQMASEILDEDESDPICIHSSCKEMVYDI